MKYDHLSYTLFFFRMIKSLNLFNPTCCNVSNWLLFHYPKWKQEESQASFINYKYSDQYKCVIWTNSTVMQVSINFIYQAGNCICKYFLGHVKASLNIKRLFFL